MSTRTKEAKAITHGQRSKAKIALTPNRMRRPLLMLLLYCTVLYYVYVQPGSKMWGNNCLA
ncbi:hypothetical protein BCV70DRAFT_95815 [Testicularia cyperi]|uniref:Uncharacterized protein n=1 Tax=Testicularia cyperi TaxID=1882483 RepID=A0A317XT17_9BASI|nr:hypothetical protein BCV70DRAFT_95815 [Testicularia cyperi]